MTDNSSSNSTIGLPVCIMRILNHPFNRCVVLSHLLSRPIRRRKGNKKNLLRKKRISPGIKSEHREAKIKACHRKARKAGGNITVPSTINSITDTVKKKTNPFSAIHSRNINRYTAQVRIHMYVVYCSKARAF